MEIKKNYGTHIVTIRMLFEFIQPHAHTHVFNASLPPFELHVTFLFLWGFTKEFSSSFLFLFCYFFVTISVIFVDYYYYWYKVSNLTIINLHRRFIYFFYTIFVEEFIWHTPFGHYYIYKQKIIFEIDSINNIPNHHND